MNGMNDIIKITNNRRFRTGSAVFVVKIKGKIKRTLKTEIFKIYFRYYKFFMV